jgi:hypothetical protein
VQTHIVTPDTNFVKYQRMQSLLEFPSDRLTNDEQAALPDGHCRFDTAVPIFRAATSFTSRSPESGPEHCCLHPGNKKNAQKIEKCIAITLPLLATGSLSLQTDPWGAQ